MRYFDIPMVDIPLIDEQHLDIVLMLTQIEEGMDTQKIARELINYATVHFTLEESCMRNQDYPPGKFIEHKLEHRRLKANLRMAIDISKLTFSLEDLRRFKVDFFSHITTQDKEWVDWWNEKRRIALPDQSG